MRSSVDDTSRERKTDGSMESTSPPKKTRTEKETEKGAEIKAEIAGVKEVVHKIIGPPCCSSSGILNL